MSPVDIPSKVNSAPPPAATEPVEWTWLPSTTVSPRLSALVSVTQTLSPPPSTSPDPSARLFSIRQLLMIRPDPLWSCADTPAPPNVLAPSRMSSPVRISFPAVKLRLTTGPALPPSRTVRLGSSDRVVKSAFQPPLIVTVPMVWSLVRAIGPEVTPAATRISFSPPAPTSVASALETVE